MSSQDVNNLISDIFGGDSDDEDIQIPSQKNQVPDTSIFGGDSDEEVVVKNKDTDVIVDSDDDEFGTNNKRGTKIMRGRRSDRPIEKRGRVDIIDSDEEDEDETNQREESSGRPKKKIKKGKKLLRSRLKSNIKSDRRRDTSAEGEGEEVDSNDEANLVATNDDRDFIADDDEEGDLVKEYEQDNQNFQGEDGDYEYDYKSKANKKKGKASSSSSAEPSSRRQKETDPLSQTLLEMKKPKAQEMSDTDKGQFCVNLFEKMATAVKCDHNCLKENKPAINKLQLLPVVKQAVSMKSLHTHLLDRDTNLLCYLRDWIYPKDKDSLPALEVRTAVYEMLLTLTISPDQLKQTKQTDRNTPDGITIGQVIVKLRKHNMETTDNKKLLKLIMDKWSRPVFAKQTDFVAGDMGTIANNPDVQKALRDKYNNNNNNNNGNTNNNGNNNTNNKTNKSFLSGDSAVRVSENDGFQRARTPFSNGFMYTVPVPLKPVDRGNAMEKTLGESRMRIFEKSKGGTGRDTLGKKSNPRALDMKI